MFIVDAVSSFSSGTYPDGHSRDRCPADRKPKGARSTSRSGTVFAISERAIGTRANHNQERGYYFDFVEFARNAEQDMTPSTPVIPLHLRAALQARRDRRKKARRLATKDIAS